jgi:branched-chain amino acid transport system ATP-binding protein
MLILSGLDVAYGRARVLLAVDLMVAEGEAVAIVGRNGAGKSTLVKAVMGLVPATAGRIQFEERDITGWAPHRIARLGIGYVPEDRRIFTDLTVLENLEAARRPARPGFTPWTRERLFALFPNLAEIGDRRSGHISGGEQQMLTLARTLMTNPRLVLLDEPSEGLAPKIVAGMVDAVRRLKAEGIAILICEQNIRFAAAIADRAAVIETGRIRWSGAMSAFLADRALQRTYLAV